MNPSWTLPLIVGLLGQAPPSPDRPEEAGARLDYMKKSVRIYAVHPAEARATAYRLLPDPILRYTNPVGQSRDGAIFLWLGAQDRPEAAVQVSVIRSGYWDHQFSSLSTHPLVAESRAGAVWSPRLGGVEFKSIPGASRPAESAEQRLRQMRALAGEFAVEDDFQHQSWQKLRLFARPAHRYGKPGTDLIDGAVFCFALGTDPEVFLLIEARAGKNGPEWHYALGPITGYPVKASYKGQEVWNGEGTRNVYGTTGSIVNIPYVPEEPGP